MKFAPVYFQFAQKKDALQAYDTLYELGYNVEMLDHDHKEHLPTLLLHVNQSDLISALEITQSHGGCLVEGKQAASELDVLTSAYALDDPGYIPIPAHAVNDEEVFDPSEGDYDHFTAGIRL
ncbi:MAG: DNA/RNA helicase [Paenibacillaceae bacterium]